MDNVLVADIIIRARRADDRHYVHAVFEGLAHHQAGRHPGAHDRAATVAAVANEPAIAAVIGEAIQPQQQLQADKIGVWVLLPTMLRQEQAGNQTTDPVC